MDIRLVFLLFACVLVASVQSYHRYGHHSYYHRYHRYGPFRRYGGWRRRYRYPIRLSRRLCRLLGRSGLYRFGRRRRLFYCPRVIRPTTTEATTTATLQPITTALPPTTITMTTTPPTTVVVPTTSSLATSPTTVSTISTSATATTTTTEGTPPLKTTTEGTPPAATTKKPLKDSSGREFVRFIKDLFDVRDDDGPDRKYDDHKEHDVIIKKFLKMLKEEEKQPVEDADEEDDASLESNDVNNQDHVTGNRDVTNEDASLVDELRDISHLLKSFE